MSSSQALKKWKSQRSRELDEIEDAHRLVGGGGPGKRFATQQINHAYVVLLSSQFQGFCRDLHSDCIHYLALQTTPQAIREVLRLALLDGRQLDKYNPSPQCLQRDFKRFGFDLNAIIKQPQNHHGAPPQRPTAPTNRYKRLTLMNNWRNAIAHQDFDPDKLGGTTKLGLAGVRNFRRLCNRVAEMLDNCAGIELRKLTGLSPW
jgi:hypothetical protein